MIAGSPERNALTAPRPFGSPPKPCRGNRAADRGGDTWGDGYFFVASSQLTQNRGSGNCFREPGPGPRRGTPRGSTRRAIGEPENFESPVDHSDPSGFFYLLPSRQLSISHKSSRTSPWKRDDEGFDPYGVRKEKHGGARFPAMNGGADRAFSPFGAQSRPATVVAALTRVRHRCGICDCAE